MKRRECLSESERVKERIGKGERERDEEESSGLASLRRKERTNENIW